MPGDTVASIGSEVTARELSVRLDAQAKLMDERDRRYTERAESDQRAVNAALAAAEKAVNAALASAEKAAEKFDKSLQEYKSVSNEWRDTVAGLVEQLKDIAELRQQCKGLEEKITDLRESRSVMRGAERQSDKGKMDIAKWVGWLLAATGLAYAIFFKSKGAP